MSLLSEFLDNTEGIVSKRAAFESEAIKSVAEEEIVIYARIGNMEGLSQASFIETHEQAEIKTPTGRIRVRKTTQNGRIPVFELTSKKKLSVGAIISNTERTRKINEDVYNMFLDVCPVFMSKTRYVFKAERLVIKRGDMKAVVDTNELNFEVDVFTKKDGSISNWCKIDIETQAIADILKKNNIGVQDIKIIASISKLPFEPDQIVIDDRTNNDPDRKALITALYEYEFLIKRDI